MFFRLVYPWSTPSCRHPSTFPPPSWSLRARANRHQADFSQTLRLDKPARLTIVPDCQIRYEKQIVRRWHCLSPTRLLQQTCQTGEGRGHFRGFLSTPLQRSNVLRNLTRLHRQNFFAALPQPVPAPALFRPNCLLFQANLRYIGTHIAFLENLLIVFDDKK